jgi:hypothetical protein
MLRLCSMLFAAVLIVVAWFIVTTTGRLADVVATHFGGDYLANGFMTRDGYLAFSLAFSTVLPVIVAGAVGLLPRLFPRSVNVPNRDYWLAAERRDATLESIAIRAILLGALLAIFMVGVHWLILQANAAVPPQLPARAFWAMLIAFLVAFAAWIVAFWSRFRNTAG